MLLWKGWSNGIVWRGSAAIACELLLLVLLIIYRDRKRLLLVLGHRALVVVPRHDGPVVRTALSPLMLLLLPLTIIVGSCG